MSRQNAREVVIDGTPYIPATNSNTIGVAVTTPTTNDRGRGVA